MKILKGHFVRPKSVKYLLHKLLPSQQEHRGVGRLHASEVTRDGDREFCPREYALCRTLRVKPKSEFIGTSLRYTFDTGWMMQDYVTRKLAKYLWGDWQCSSCDVYYRRCGYVPLCSKCGSANVTYLELVVISKVSGISGGIDLLVNVGQPLLKVVEIKTIKADAFKSLVTPLPEHRLRTNLYMRLVEESGEPYANAIDTDSALVLYMCKGFGVKSPLPKAWKIKDSPFTPFKEYIVMRADEDTEALHQRALSLAAFSDKGEYPEGICGTQYCHRAQSCPVIGPCFGGEYLPGGKDDIR